MPKSGRPFLLILGASGAGKSSLAQAGIVPALGVRGVVRGVGAWRRAVMRPGQDPAGPFASLAAALTADEALPELLKGQDVLALSRHLEASTADPAFPIASAIAARDQSGHDQQQLARHERVKLVLVVDQLEELFTLGKVTPERRKAFIACLEGLIQSGCVFVVATMRNDHWHRASELPRLIALAEGHGRFDLLNAGPAEITEMIRRPAEIAGLDFETDPRTEIKLDAALAEEAAREPGALPLLSFLLDALYAKDVEANRSTTLTYASMHALGGLKGAIAARADAAIAALPVAVQAAMPKMLRALVTVSRSGAEPTARVAPMARFTEGSAERQMIDGLLGPQIRLLVAEGDGQSARVRLAHEALISHWERAKRQIAQDRDDLRTRTAVEEAEIEWRSAPTSRKRLYLLRDPLLANALDLLRRWGDELGLTTADFIRASHRRARLRQRLTAAAAVIFGFVAAVAVIAAEEAVRAKRQADAERQLAQQTLVAATKTANSLIFDLAQRFRNTVGVPSDIVRDILQRAMALQGELASSGQGTPDVQFSEADALAENAQTLLVQGDSAGALVAAERANGILRGLLAQGANNKEWRHDLAASYEIIGDAQLALGRRQEALDAFQESLKGWKQLATDYPDNSGLQHGLAVSYLTIGDTMVVENRLDEALAAYQRSLAIEQEAFELGRPGLDWRHDLATSYERIGDVMKAQDKSDDALTAYRKSLDIRRALAAEDIGNSSSQRDLSVSYERIGDIMAANGWRDDAIASLQNSGDVATHPISAKLQKRTLASAADKPGDHPSADAEFDDAIAMYQNGLAIRQQLAESDKANAQWQRDLSIIFMKLGDVLEAEQKHDAALTAYQSGAAAAERLPVGTEGNVEWQRDQYVARERIGTLLLERGKFDDALAAFQNSLELRQKLAATDPSDEKWQSDLFIIYDKIGDLQLSEGSFDKALASYQSSLDIRRRLAGNADNVQRQTDRSVGYMKVGDALAALGKHADALDSYVKSIAIARAAAGENADNSSHDLDFGLSRAANILLKLARPAEAFAYLNDLSQVAPDDPSVYFDRGRAGLYSDRLQAANDDLAKAIALKPNNPYFVIWLHIGRQRAHENDQQEFTRNAEPLNHAKWPWPVVALFLRSIDQQAVLDIAQSGESPRVRLERGCEADFYLGAFALERNAKDDALKLLQSAAVGCPSDFLEKSAAKLELMRLASEAQGSARP